MKSFRLPFKYFIKEDFFSAENYHLLKEFGSKILWEFFNDPNFPQYISPRNDVENFFLHNNDSASKFRFLFEHNFIKELEHLFEITLKTCASILYHKLTKGCFNIVHNDSNTFGEKIRIICYLSAPADYQGGDLNLFEESNLEKPVQSYKFQENSAFLFAMTDNSFHSVSEVTQGDRICIVITFK